MIGKFTNGGLDGHKKLIISNIFSNITGRTQQLLAFEDGKLKYIKKLY